MRTSCFNFPDNNHLGILKTFSALVGAVLLCFTPSVRADVPDASPASFGGIYKVTSSTDPIFPATAACEFFLDFGRGIQADRLNGSVAVSMRVNPSVKVRMFSWQYFPEQGKILIGNPYAEGSRKAVAMGAWKMTGISNGVVFERGNYQVVLQRAEPGDY